MLVQLARTQVHLIGAESRLAGLRNSFHSRISNVAVLYHQLLTDEEICAVPGHAACNSPEFTELHGQN